MARGKQNQGERIMRVRLLAACAALCLVIVPVDAGAQTNTSETYRQLNLFGDVFERVRSDYVKEVGDEDLIESAIFVADRSTHCRGSRQAKPR